MRALVQERYGGAADLWVQDWPMPVPGPDEVRVRVLACGANASDWEFVTAHPFYARAFGLFRSGRRVLGSDVMGVVDAVGPGVTRLAVGQRVLGDIFGTFGGFAEAVVAPERMWVPVPEGLDPVVAASLPQSGTIALAGTREARAGQRVLINGAGGGSGVLAVQMAVAAGAEVTAVDNAAKLPLLGELGAHHLIDYEQQDFARGGARYDLIFDLWGTRGIAAVRRCLARGGRYLWVGGHTSVLIRLLIWGGLLSRLTDRSSRLLVVQQGPARLSELMEMVSNGRIRPYVGETAGLEDAPAALARMGAGQVCGKLVIVP